MSNTPYKQRKRPIFSACSASSITGSRWLCDGQVRWRDPSADNDTALAREADDLAAGAGSTHTQHNDTVVSQAAAVCASPALGSTEAAALAAQRTTRRAAFLLQAPDPRLASAEKFTAAGGAAASAPAALLDMKVPPPPTPPGASRPRACHSSSVSRSAPLPV